MISTVWRDGYGLSVEIIHATPEACPDGVVRIWHDVVIRDDDAPADAVELRLSPDDLAELGSVLHAIAHDGIADADRAMAEHPHAEPCAYVQACGNAAAGRNRHGITTCRRHGGMP